MEVTGEKKSTSWVDRWKARRQLRTVDREREAREKALRDRGEWGYIPPGVSLVSDRLVRVNIAIAWVTCVVVAFAMVFGFAARDRRIESLERRLAVLEATHAHPSQSATPP